MKDTCAYCGVEGEDLRPCEMCHREVCWHPTCRNVLDKRTVCVSCAGKLPEVSENNPDWTNGKCPICQGDLHFLMTVEVSESKKNRSVPALAYSCDRDHVVFACDHGYSREVL